MFFSFLLISQMDIRIKCAFVTANQVAHVNCGNCRMLLMYQYGARSVKCAVCNFVTSVGVSTTNEFLLYIAVYKSCLMYSKWGQIIIKKVNSMKS